MNVYWLLLNFRSRSLQQARLSLTPRLCRCHHTQVWFPVFISAASSGPVFVPCLFLLPLLVLFLSHVYSFSGPVFVPCLFLLPLPVLCPMSIPLLVLFLSLFCFCFLFWSCFCPISVPLPVLFLSLVYSCFLFRSCFCPSSFSCDNLVAMIKK